MKILGLVIMGIAIALFYAIFFRAAPFLGSLLPATEWTPILKVVVYFLIAWVGGIALPLIVFIVGFIWALQ